MQTQAPTSAPPSPPPQLEAAAKPLLAAAITGKIKPTFIEAQMLMKVPDAHWAERADSISLDRLENNGVILRAENSYDNGSQNMGWHGTLAVEHLGRSLGRSVVGKHTWLLLHLLAVRSSSVSFNKAAELGGHWPSTRTHHNNNRVDDYKLNVFVWLNLTELEQHHNVILPTHAEEAFEIRGGSSVIGEDGEEMYGTRGGVEYHWYCDYLGIETDNN